jgi:hypothetical protein
MFRFKSISNFTYCKSQVSSIFVMILCLVFVQSKRNFALIPAISSELHNNLSEPKILLAVQS